MIAPDGPFPHPLELSKMGFVTAPSFQGGWKTLACFQRVGAHSRSLWPARLAVFGVRGSSIAPLRH